MSFIQRLFGKSDESSEVLCPHCERAMEPGHRCVGMSRRFFFGAMAGAAAIIAVPAPVVLAPHSQLALASWEDLAMVNRSMLSGTFCISILSVASYNRASAFTHPFAAVKR